MQQLLVLARQGDEIEDQLILLEHPPVVTLGRGADAGHLKVDPAWLQQQGVEVVRCGRGGEITYHGPGQLVAYPILKLPEGRRDVHRYLRDLEQVLIDVLADYQVEGRRIEGKTGVWVGKRKIASLGVRTSRWVTSHGLALNYGEDLAGFHWMTPCGLAGVEMTSLALERQAVPRFELENRFCRHFQGVFARVLHSRNEVD